MPAPAELDADGSEGSEDDARAYGLQPVLVTDQQQGEDSDFEMEDDTEALDYLSSVRYSLCADLQASTLECQRYQQLVRQGRSNGPARIQQCRCASAASGHKARTSLSKLDSSDDSGCARGLQL